METSDLQEDSSDEFTTQGSPKDHTQEQNRSGGYVWSLGPWEKLRRFLVLGVEGGTYYTSQQELTQENVSVLKSCVDQNARRVVNEILKVSDRGEAVQQGTVLFSLAYVLKKADDKEDRKRAGFAMSEVVRTGSHLLRFAHYVNYLGGWSTIPKKAFEAWYNTKYENGNLAYQILKYPSRRYEGNRWSHQDVLRLCYAEPTCEGEAVIYDYITGDAPDWDEDNEQHRLIQAREQAHEVGETDLDTIADLIEHPTESSTLPREALPTEVLNEKRTWEALLRNDGRGMPIWALLRNLGKLSSVGIITPLSEGETEIAEQLTHEDRLKRARMHPLSVLQAIETYKSGGGVRGSLEWSPSDTILEALNEAFYKSFDYLEPTGQDIVLALDVSGSMSTSTVSGMTSVTPRMAAAALAMSYVRAEDNVHTIAFSGESTFNDQQAYTIEASTGPWGREASVLPVPSVGRGSIEHTIEQIKAMNFGQTDCSLPMRYAEDRGIEADGFVILTDNETNSYAAPQPTDALESYRSAYNPGAALITVGMTSNGFSIADPNDPRQMDVVGCSPTTPTIINRVLTQAIAEED